MNLKKSTALVATLFVVFISQSFGQVPQAFKYQAVVRDTSGSLLINRSIPMLVAIMDDSTVLYQETHHPATNAYGLIGLEIGNGSPVSGTFAAIDWAAGNRFIQLESDMDGDGVFVLLSNAQLLAVPYALHAGNAATGDNLGNHIATQTLQLNGNFISGDGEQEGLFISDEGKAGIGTNNPQGQLHIAQNGTDPTQLLVENDSLSFLLQVDSALSIGYVDNSTGDFSATVTVTSQGQFGVNSRRPASDFEVMKYQCRDMDGNYPGNPGGDYLSNNPCKEPDVEIGEPIGQCTRPTKRPDVNNNDDHINTMEMLFSGAVVNGDTVETGRGMVALRPVLSQVDGLDGAGFEIVTQNGTDNINALVIREDGRIGMGNNPTPDSSAVLDLSASRLGFLLPSMTTAERLSISNPAQGLMVFDQSEGKIFTQTAGVWEENATTSTVWRLSGNSGTAPGNHFIGTTDSTDLVFKTNQTEGMRLDEHGSFAVADADTTTINELFNPPFSQGVGMQWYKHKAAFRAGIAGANQWSRNNTGFGSASIGVLNSASGKYSLAIGLNCTALDTASFAIGVGSTSEAVYSVALGRNNATAAPYSFSVGTGNFALGDYAMAFGSSNFASAQKSIVLGHNSTASGNNSAAIGDSLLVRSFSETVIGSHNTDYVPASTNDWDDNDRLFVVANGIPTHRSDALVVLKNGNVGIGNSTPTERLHVDGNICFTGSSFSCSDLRYKKNIRPLENSLEKLAMIEGLFYDWKTGDFPEKNFSPTTQIGFIAQDVEKVFPEIVNTDSEGFKSVDYSRLTPILVEATKSQQEVIESLQAQINGLKAEKTNYLKRLEKVEGLLYEALEKLEESAGLK